jgi:signal transduction histidine kinase
MEGCFAGQLRRVGRYLVGQHRRGGHRGTVSVLLVATIAGCLFSQSISAAPTKEVRRILIFNLLDPLSSPGAAPTDRAMVADLENGPPRIELYSENLQPVETLNAALHLQPGTKHVVVVGATGANDRHLEAIVKESFRTYEGSLTDSALWERAEWAVLAALAVFLALAYLTGYLLFKQKQLKQARKDQRQLSGMLINAQEQERSRIAADLHDDFSQRLAVLALDLETCAETIYESPEEANRRLHELLDYVSQMGADLHTLSHRLHSSTLESLGLVPGVSAFCKEFEAQQGIRVDFTHEGIPRSVPPEVALCLFRLVQEGLRNLKKHSGASEGQVSLAMIDNILHLSICDHGVGFDLNELLNKEGLGIQSMRERVHLVDGRFEISSTPRKGTKIDVWVRFQPKTVLDNS